MLVKNWVSMLYCRRKADFISASLFSQIVMFTVSLVSSKTFLNSEVVLLAFS